MVSPLDDLLSPFRGGGGVAGLNDEHMVVLLVSYFAEQPMKERYELCRFNVLVHTMGDRFGSASSVLSCHLKFHG